MTSAVLEKVDIKNEGIAREWSVCHYMGIERTTHDHTSYDKDSDVVINDMKISVKSSAFTLMSGTLCEGRTDFEGIWKLYESKVHSNTFAYVTKDYTMYLMNMEEFKEFVYRFCTLDKESGSKLPKIRCRKESSKMIKWLEAQI